MTTCLIRPVVEADLADFLAVDRHASHGARLSRRAYANFLGRREDREPSVVIIIIISCLCERVTALARR